MTVPDWVIWTGIALSVAALVAAIYPGFKAWYLERFAPLSAEFLPETSVGNVNSPTWVLRAKLRSRSSDRILLGFGSLHYAVLERPDAIGDITWVPYDWTHTEPVQHGTLEIPPHESREVRWLLTAHRVGLHRIQFTIFERAPGSHMYSFDVTFESKLP